MSDHQFAAEVTAGEGRISHPLFNRPEAGNARSCGMIAGLRDALLWVEAPRP